jgi:hypothetical protein
LHAGRRGDPDWLPLLVDRRPHAILPPMPDGANERRQQLRHTTQGTVLLRDEKDGSVRVLAQLINVTECGFSVSHFHNGFAVGQVVKFQEWFRAKVIWTRMAVDHHETGFFIIQQ